MNLGPHPIGIKTWCEEIRAGLFSQHPMPWSRDPLSGSRIVSIAEVGGMPPPVFLTHWTPLEHDALAWCPRTSTSSPWESGRHIRRRQPEKWMCVEHKMVESKYLQNCPGRRITLWGYEGQKEDRWVEIRLESRFPLPVSAFWQTRCPRSRRPWRSVSFRASV